MKIKTQTVHVVDAFEFERFVKEQIGRTFSFQAAMECGNDTEHEIEPFVDLENYEYDKKELESYLAGDGYEGYNTSALLLGKFVREGLIPDGTYLIRLSY